MRIVVNDFAGHPFQVQLSRELASRGHSVLHTYLGGLQGPKGALSCTPADPPMLAIRSLCEGLRIEKYSLLSRFRCHLRYAAELRAATQKWKAEVVISANMPIDAQRGVQKFCRRSGVRFVHWMQDLYCLALENLFRQKFGPAGRVPARVFFEMERKVCEEADAVVLITPAFGEYLAARGVDSRVLEVIENWAPLSELTPVSRDNAWAREQRLEGTPAFLYSGTLGMKHRPELLSALAARLQELGRGELTVISEGIGREYLDAAARRQTLRRLRTLDYQRYARLSEVLGAADILVAIIDREAGQFAVPSKVLSYLCAGRPILLASPEDNLAAEAVRRADAGVIVEPEDTAGFLRAAEALAGDPARCLRLGENARRYALQTFDIARIAGRFERLCLPFEVTGPDTRQENRSRILRALHRHAPSSPSAG